MANPIEQFKIVSYGHFNLFGTEIHFTNQALWMLLGITFISTVIIMAARGKTLVPSRLQSVVEMTYEFVQDMLKGATGTAGLKYMPLIFTLFLFIAVMNVFGMIPGSYTGTSQITVTAVLALSVFSSVILIGLARHGFKFFGLFYPPGVPWFMAILLVPLEIISFFIRPLTLMIRLGANMVAGHIALKVFASFIVGGLVAFGQLPIEYLAALIGLLFFVAPLRRKIVELVSKSSKPALVWLIIAAGLLVLWPSLMPLAGLFALTGLEVFVAFLQAYVFTLLTCVYLNDALHLH